MAQSGVAKWTELPRPVQDVFARAAASEQGIVGSRGILIGIMRSGEGADEPAQLLRHFDVDQPTFFRALQAVRAAVLIDASITDPSQLDTLPSLTPNANDILKRADSLRAHSKLEPKHIFGGLLQATESTAYKALASVLDVTTLSQVAEQYSSYLTATDGSYRTFLQQRFPRPGSSVGAAPDRGTEDQLNFKHYIEAFAELIESTETQPPLTIGIYGVWGSGKSFLLDRIEYRLEHQSRIDTPGWLKVVKFNAWEYSASDVIWPGLVRKIMRTLDEQRGFVARWRLRLSRNLRRQLLVARSRIIVGATVLGVGLVLAGFQSTFHSAALLLTIGVVGFGGAVKLVSDSLTGPFGQWFTALFEDRR